MGGYFSTAAESQQSCPPEQQNLQQSTLTRSESEPPPAPEEISQKEPRNTTMLINPLPDQDKQQQQENKQIPEPEQPLPDVIAPPSRTSESEPKLQDQVTAKIESQQPKLNALDPLEEAKRQSLECGWTLLHVAAFSNEVDVIEDLIKEGKTAPFLLHCVNKQKVLILR